MQTLIFIGLLILGVITYYVFNSIKYIVSGRFMFGKWYADNFAFYVWACAVCVVLGTVYAVAPDSVGQVLGFVGIDAQNVNGKPVPPVIVGMLISGATKRLSKPIKIETPAVSDNPAEAKINPN